MGQWSNESVAKATGRVDFGKNPLTAAAGARAIPGLDLPVGAHVVGVYLKIVVAEGGTCGIDIGDDLPTADPDGYISNADGNATAGSITVTAGAFATTVNGQGRPITAACNMTIDVDNDADTAVVDVIVYARMPGN